MHIYIYIYTYIYIYHAIRMGISVFGSWHEPISEVQVMLYSP